MDDDVTVSVQPCLGCARGKNVYLRAGGLLQPLPVPCAAWEDIALDLVVGLPEAGTKRGVNAKCERFTVHQEIKLTCERAPKGEPKGSPIGENFFFKKY